MRDTEAQKPNEDEDLELNLLHQLAALRWMLLHQVIEGVPARMRLKFNIFEDVEQLQKHAGRSGYRERHHNHANYDKVEAIDEACYLDQSQIK